MKEFIESIPKEVLIGLAVSSVAMFVGSIIVLRIAVARMAEDYFMPNREVADSLANKHPFWRMAGLVGKNLAGLFLIIVGLLLSLPGIPGQGLLTILMGLVLMNFPGKRKMELWLVQRGPIRKSLNWIRHRSGKTPLLIPVKATGVKAAIAPAG